MGTIRFNTRFHLIGLSNVKEFFLLEKRLGNRLYRSGKSQLDERRSDHGSRHGHENHYRGDTTLDDAERQANLGHHHPDFAPRNHSPADAHTVHLADVDGPPPASAEL